MYSVELTLRVLDPQNLTAKVFAALLDTVGKVKNERALQRTLLGFVSLLESPQKLPPVQIK
jgi:hypothetical protein